VFKDRLEGIFEGAGQMVGGETVPFRLVPSNINSQSKHQKLQSNESPYETQLPGDDILLRKEYISLERCLNFQEKKCPWTNFSISFHLMSLKVDA
jgi:hypothetical protein